MYSINLNEKKAYKLKETTFTEIGIKERYDIQEWIANDPSLLEYSLDLLIIQKEFDGFGDTNKRLDLLALDSQGNLVVIENKRDDTGKDVVWQAINYASFCSTLNSQDIIRIYQKYLDENGTGIDAEQSINDFFGNEAKVYPTNTQKIILVSREFRKEVLSAAQWLYTNNIDITCIKFTPYIFNNEILLDVDRILPQEEIKDYTIKLSKKVVDAKNQEAIYSRAEERNIKFWSFFATLFDRRETIFENVNSWSSNKNSWIGASAGFGHGLYFNFVIKDDGYRVELYLDGEKNYNKKVYDCLYSNKLEIEKKVAPEQIVWERLDHRRASRISINGNQYTLTDTSNWENVVEFFKNNMNKLINAFDEFKKDVNEID